MLKAVPQPLRKAIPRIPTRAVAKATLIPKIMSTVIAAIPKYPATKGSIARLLQIPQLNTDNCLSYVFDYLYEKTGAEKKTSQRNTEL